MEVGDIPSRNDVYLLEKITAKLPDTRRGTTLFWYLVSEYLVRKAELHLCSNSHDSRKDSPQAL